MKLKLLYRLIFAVLFVILFAAIGYVLLKPSRAANADINGDGKVDVLDLSILATNFGSCVKTFSTGDLNSDGCVNILDLSVLASGWGGTSGYQRPFGSSADWNTPVAGLPISPDSANLVAQIWDGAVADGYKAELHIFDDGYTFAVFDASQATVTANVVSDVYPANITTIPWNPNWQGPNGSDSQAAVIDQATGREWDLWQINPNSKPGHGYNSSTNTLTVSNAHLCSGDYRTATASTCPDSRGAGLNYLALLVRPQEIQQGHIDHALAFPIDQVNSSFVSPAVRSDAGGGYVPMGTRIAIHATDTEIANFVATLPFNSTGKNTATIILKAIRDYGMIVTDNGGQPTTQLEDIASSGNAWTNLGIHGNWTWTAPFVTQSRMYAIVPGNQY